MRLYSCFSQDRTPSGFTFAICKRTGKIVLHNMVQKITLAIFVLHYARLYPAYKISLRFIMHRGNMISYIAELFVGQCGLKSKFPCKYLRKSPISNGALILIHIQTAELMDRRTDMTDKRVKEPTKCQIS